MARALYFVVMAAWLLACGQANQGRVVIPPQQWQDISIRVEVRPEPVREGMNEFIIIINDHLKGIRPAHDYLVSLRTADRLKWRQAIQDGHSGVYRRAVPLLDLAQPVLQLHIEKGGESTTLYFPLDNNKNVEIPQRGGQ